MSDLAFNSAEELAAHLDGITYPVRLDKEIKSAAAARGLVIVYGASDDLMELDGAIYDEVDCYEGGSVQIDQQGVIPSKDQADEDGVLEEWFQRKRHAYCIEAVWAPGDNVSWAYNTTIPHAVFNVVEDDEVYCRGIVFDMAKLSDKSDFDHQVEAMLAVDTSDESDGPARASRRHFCELLVKAGFKLTPPAATDNTADADRASVCLAACEGVDTEDLRGKSIGEYVADQAFLNGMLPAENGFEIQLNGMACQLLAASFAGQFKGSGATNYLEVNFQHKEVGEMSVTLQRVEGKTPATLRAEADNRCSQAMEIVDMALNDSDPCWRDKADAFLLSNPKS